MTTRDRREAKAARLTEWAAKRDAKAEALHAQNAPYRGDVAFNTQPGHIPERARVIARSERAFEHSAKADEMQSRAAGITSQLERTIFDDDPDAQLAVLFEPLDLLAQAIERRRSRSTRYRSRSPRLGHPLDALRVDLVEGEAVRAGPAHGPAAAPQALKCIGRHLAR